MIELTAAEFGVLWFLVGAVIGGLAGYIFGRFEQ